MKMGLVLDASAPLYGRAQEIIPIKPLGAGWIHKALKLGLVMEILDAYSFWCGIPRYWELANDNGGGWEAAHRLVLDPQGVLHNEPKRLLLDDLRETAQAASILFLIGQGCHRISEIAVRFKNFWFWIDDRDFHSKRTFTFLMILFSLTEKGSGQDLPLVTIPSN